MTYILYIVVRQSLNMTSGKVAAQCVHVMDLIYRQFMSNDFKLSQKIVEPCNYVTEGQYRKGNFVIDIKIGETDNICKDLIECNYADSNSFYCLLTEPDILESWPNIIKPSKIESFKFWQNKLSTVVVLKAGEKDWQKLKKLPDCFVMRDAGLTEVEPETETCLGFWPLLKEDAPKLIQHLRLL